MLNVIDKLDNLLPDVKNAELYSQMFDDFHEGVMILDIHTVLLYYNEAQGLIDDLRPEQARGRTVLDLYRVGDNTSYPTLRCLFSRKPLLNQACYYYTHLGKLVNSIHNVFPLTSNGELAGCICFIRDFGQLMSQYDMASDNIGKSVNGGGSRRAGYTFDQIITRDSMMRKSLDIAAMAADTPSPIMIYGPTGCGKEMVAQALHNESARRQKPFVAVNCAAIPESLLEGMLFGTTKGAFTGALDKPGLMELADGGTIFLDEINSMPLGLQSKMLRALQDQRI
ncbi:sigma 54-interacting transcriptional regulator, partial [Deltaproteobacteria bacterium OttesenSCG-928-M10]|nr:sigma 54-interacting transcriptional regulator [Deltaproteobacteria bacterium OttesenSCG-928-M10]